MLAGGYQSFIGGHNQETATERGKALGLYDDNGRFRFADDLMKSPGLAFAEIGDVLRQRGISDERSIAEAVGQFTSSRNVAELITKAFSARRSYSARNPQSARACRPPMRPRRLPPPTRIRLGSAQLRRCRTLVRRSRGRRYRVSRAA